MKLIPLPHYFIIKIDIKKQKQRKAKIGSGVLYSHVNEVFMKRNMQSGEVVAIGSIAAKQFKEVSIGDTLLIHHFVEGDNDKSNFIYSDETYNYYTCTAKEFNGRRNESYAVYKNGKIIPHPDFVFIEKEETVKEISAEEFVEKNTKKVGSLFLFNEWKENREDLENKASTIIKEIKSQSQGKHLRDDVKIGLEEKQKEAGRITNSLNKKEYIKRKVAFHHPSLKVKENIFVLNLASETELEVFDKKYIVIQTKYISATA
jgi:co-chaperonin GroES (HSP10)